MTYVSEHKQMVWETNLVDINNDTGFEKIASIINTLPTHIQPEIQRALREVQQLELKKEASSTSYLLEGSKKLPIHNVSNILLSKVYLVGQEKDIPASIYKVASEKIDKLCSFFEINTDDLKINSDSLKKEASIVDHLSLNVKYLLPEEQLFPVTNEGDLEKAASIYTLNENKFLIGQKVEFARNFVKLAADYDVDMDIPTNIAKYASILDTDLNMLSYFLEKRADWVEIHNPDKKLEHDVLCKLASSFKNADDLEKIAEYTGDINKLNHLAFVIDNIDKEVGIGRRQYNSIFPDAFGTVFNKEAADVLPPVGLGITSGDTDTSGYRGNINAGNHTGSTPQNNENITEAQILTNFGPEVLEDLRNEDGELDQERAAALIHSIKM